MRQRANLFRDQGYLEDAVRAYTQAQALDPLNARIIVEQSILLALQGRYERALDQLDPLLTDGPDQLLVTLAMSKISALDGNSDRSLQLALQAQTLAADNPIVLTRLVDAHIQLGRLDDAETVLQLALTVAPENESVPCCTRYESNPTRDCQHRCISRLSRRSSSFAAWDSNGNRPGD